VLFNNFSGGSSGGTISTGNSGGASGNAFDSVIVGTTSSLTYDTAHTIHSVLSAKSANGTPTTNSILEWAASLGGSFPQVWFRTYLYITANPVSNARFFDARQGSTAGASIAITTAGKIAAQDTSFTTQATSTTVMPQNAWVRIEGYVIGSASAGQIQVKIFTTPDATSPAETITTAGNLNTLGTINRVDYGNPSSAVSYTFWMADVGVSTTGYTGPAVARTGLSIIPQLVAAGVLP
jgi:hypothetical protein